MIIVMFTLGFAIVFVLTSSYKFLEQYSPTILFISSISLLYPLLCRGHLLWHFRDWLFFTDKLSLVTQSVILFPTTMVLFLRFFPEKMWAKVAHFLGFFAIYVLMELLLMLRHDIVYEHGWTFWWSVFIDFCLFGVAWLYMTNRKIALPVSTFIVVFLMVWFRVPLDG